MKLAAVDLLLRDGFGWLGFGLNRAFTKRGPRTRVFCGAFGLDFYWRYTK